MARRRQLGELPEDDLLNILLAGVPAGRNIVVPPGDDCAAVKISGSPDLLLLKTDCVVENVHYLPSHSPARVGWKALCRAISDIAAMGGEPLHALVNIFSPRSAEVAYWRGLYRGLTKAAKKFGVGLVGGETSSAPFAAVSVHLVGRVEPSRLLTRSGGHPGDRLLVTGRLGGSIAGHHLDFVPRLEEGRWLSAQGSVSAMMDLSDGLASDLPRLAIASKCGFTLDANEIPRRRGCTTTQAMADGEDYELLLAVSPRRADELQRAWKRRFPKVSLTEIGCLTEGPLSSSGLPRGFDHFLLSENQRSKQSKTTG